ncbi:hypothetical protein Tco_0421539 [Tanacetum coccineum]
MILESVEHGPLIWPTVEENSVIRTKKYAELSAAEKIQADCDMKATNIILQGLPADIYSLVNHHRVAKDLWERVQLLMQGTSLTKQERECKLYDAFNKFTHIKGESLHTYYLRFTQLINDMNIYKMKMEQFQVNTKFLNSLPPEWSKFVTNVKLVKDLHTSNFDQLHAYLEQHELHANEVRFAVPVFSPGDDLIACLNKAMAFLTAIASSRVTVQQVQGRQGKNYSGTTYKGNATSSRGNTTSGQTRVEFDVTWIILGGIAWIKGNFHTNAHVSMHVIDDEETLNLEEESRSKIYERAKDPKVIAKKISHKPIDYEKFNRLTENFGKRFSPQQELSAEQAFWFHILNPTIEPPYTPPVIVDVPSELPKVSLVNASLKKIKFHLTQFDSVVKKRTTPNALKEGEWGFEHTQTVFNNEIIPFLKSLKDIFNVFDKDLLNEITEVQTVFDQMEVAVQQSSVDKQFLEIAKK